MIGGSFAFRTWMFLATLIPGLGLFIGLSAHRKQVTLDEYEEPDRRAFYRDLTAWCITMQFVWVFLVVGVLVT